MKKSHLKEMIKSSLKEENQQGSVKLKKGTPDSEIKKYTSKGIDVELNETSENIKQEIIKLYKKEFLNMILLQNIIMIWILL